MFKQMPTLQIILILVAFASVAFLSVLLGSTKNNAAEVIENRSVFNSQPSGLRAWVLALQKTNFPVEIWERPFRDLEDLSDPASMLMIQPYTAARSGIIYGETESTQLLKWVAQGNTLILLDDFQRMGSKALLQQLGLGTHPLQRITIPQSLLLMSDAGINRFMHANPRSQPKFYFVATPEKLRQVRVILQTRSGQPVWLQVSYGNGHLILGTTTDLVDNRWLHQNADDNFQLLSNLVALEKKPLFINEFVHGYNQVEDIFAYLREKTPVGSIFMQLIFVFLLVLWLSFSRWTPVFKREENKMANANGMSQWIDSLSSIYYRRHAADAAIQPQLSQIKQILRRRYHLELDDRLQLQNLLESLFAQYSNSEIAALLASLEDAQKLVADEMYEPQRSHRALHQLSLQLSMIQDRLHAQR